MLISLDLASHDPIVVRRAHQEKIATEVLIKNGEAVEEIKEIEAIEPKYVVRIRHITTALRLTNNALTNLDGLGEEAAIAVGDIEPISWIDISHNQLESIGAALTPFPNLKVLYLHGNKMTKLRPLLEDISRSCPNLLKLTLFGNPVEEKKAYRWIVAHAFPRLQSLDFIRVTPRDRDLAKVWARMHRRQPKPDKPQQT